MTSTIPIAGSEATYIAADLRSLACEVAALNPAPNNARKHELTKDIPVLMESLRRFGQRKAVVGKRLYNGVPDAILAGNGTLMAAQRLGWDYLAVSWFEGTDDEAQEYALLDNRTAELSEWNLEELSKQMKEIRERGGDVTSLGWLAHEAEPLMRAEWAPPAREALPGGETLYHAVSFTLEQWVNIEAFVERLKVQEQDDKMSVARCLELLVADFMAGPIIEEPKFQHIPESAAPEPGGKKRVQYHGAGE